VTGAPGADFTSSLFLGLRHDSRTLPSWTSFTTGAPAALHEAAGAHRIGRVVAAGHGAGAGLAARSTLHAMIDVLTQLARPGDVVAVDRFAYPIAQWATLLADAGGATVCTYPHHRPGGIALPAGRRLLVVTDAWCAGCNRPAPLAALGRLARRGRGRLVVDDSLAFGVLGRRAAGEPFGDGSGTLRWSGLGHDGVVWVASMAKGYGAPMAVVTADAGTIARIAHEGGNRLYSSPPSAADLAAAVVALGDRGSRRAQRARLHALVVRLRAGVRGAGLPAHGLPFPTVSVPLRGPGEATRWSARLADAGIRTLVQQPACRPGALLTAIVRADHHERDIERLVDALRGLTRRPYHRVAA
jgi:8-amino-7-oxononanoate synthase